MISDPKLTLQACGLLGKLLLTYDIPEVIADYKKRLSTETDQETKREIRQALVVLSEALPLWKRAREVVAEETKPPARRPRSN